MLLRGLIDRAKKLDSTPARVALNWVQPQPGVTSTIIGARRLDQPDDNIGCLELSLPQEVLDALQTDTFGISPEGDGDRF